MGTISPVFLVLRLTIGQNGRKGVSVTVSTDSLVQSFLEVKTRKCRDAKE